MEEVARLRATGSGISRQEVPRLYECLQRRLSGDHTVVVRPTLILAKAQTSHFDGIAPDQLSTGIGVLSRKQIGAWIEHPRARVHVLERIVRFRTSNQAEPLRDLPSVSGARTSVIRLFQLVVVGCFAVSPEGVQLVKRVLDRAPLLLGSGGPPYAIDRRIDVIDQHADCYHAANVSPRATGAKAVSRSECPTFLIAESSRSSRTSQGPPTASATRCCASLTRPTSAEGGQYEEGGEEQSAAARPPSARATNVRHCADRGGYQRSILAAALIAGEHEKSP